MDYKETITSDEAANKLSDISHAFKHEALRYVITDVTKFHVGCINNAQKGLYEGQIPIMLSKYVIPNIYKNLNVWYVFKVKPKSDIAEYDEFGISIGIDTMSKFIIMSEYDIKAVTSKSFYGKLDFVFCFLISNTIPYSCINDENSSIVAQIFCKKYESHAHLFSTRSMMVFNMRMSIAEFGDIANSVIPANQLTDYMLRKDEDDQARLFNHFLLTSRRDYYGPYMMLGKDNIKEWAEKKIPSMKGAVYIVYNVPCLKLDTYVKVNKHHPGWYVYYMKSETNTYGSSVYTEEQFDQHLKTFSQSFDPDILTKNVSTCFFIYDVMAGKYYAKNKMDRYLSFEPNPYACFQAADMIRVTSYQSMTLNEFYKYFTNLL